MRFDHIVNQPKPQTFAYSAWNLTSKIGTQRREQETAERCRFRHLSWTLSNVSVFGEAQKVAETEADRLLSCLICPLPVVQRQVSQD